MVDLGVPSPTVLSLLGPAVIADLAGPRSYARGVGYRHDGRVEVQRVTEERVEAVVRGTVPYQVDLGVADGGLHWSCSCPVGEDGEFCKHCVAVALAVADTTRTGGDDATGRRSKRQSRRRSAPERPVIDLPGYVASLDHARLVDVALEQAEADWRLRERLFAAAAAAAGAGIDEGAWRSRLDAVFAPYDDFVPYREAGGWAAEVNEVIASLGELVDAGHAAAVVALAERAHRLADAAVQYVDDSDGWLSDISSTIGDLHQRACLDSRPDPVGLAGRLVALELDSELDAFHRAAVTYADVLGDQGLAEYRRIVEPRWKALRTTSDRGSTERFRLREAMTGVALVGGDPDDLIAVQQDDLRTPDAYREIVEALRSAGRIDDAVDWARRGLEAHRDRPWQTPPLQDQLAELLSASGDTDGAVEVYSRAFDQHPSLDAYRRLLAGAAPAGRSDDARVRAIDRLHARVEQRRPEDVSSRSVLTSTPVAALVDILLFDGAVDAAWKVATGHGASDRQWMTLARTREADHPLDAIVVYERETYAQIDTRKNTGYRNAVDLLARIRMLTGQAGEPDRFESLLAEVRARHKPKRNLMALLAKAGW